MCYHLAEYDVDLAMNAEYIQSLHHAAQDEEQYVEQLSVDEIQRLSAKKGPGLNFSVSGTGTKDQMSWKLKVSETNPIDTLVVNRIRIPSENFLTIRKALLYPSSKY